MKKRILHLLGALSILLSSCHAVRVPEEVFRPEGIWKNDAGTMVFYSPAASLTAYGKGLVNGEEKRMSFRYSPDSGYRSTRLLLWLETSPSSNTPNVMTLEAQDYTVPEGGNPTVTVHYSTVSAEGKKEEWSIRLTRYPFEDVPEDPFLVPPQEAFYDPEHSFSFSTADGAGYACQSYDGKVDGKDVTVQFDPKTKAFSIWGKKYSAVRVYAQGTYSYDARTIRFFIEGDSRFGKDTKELVAIAPVKDAGAGK